MSNTQTYYTVRDLIAKLSTMPLEVTVLLQLGVHDSKAALEDTWGLPGPATTVGANHVLLYDNHNVYVLHATRSDFERGKGD